MSSEKVTAPNKVSTDKLTRPGQWRLSEVQLANWGTFDQQLYRIPIARHGHLITGPSGSGKSSLLDAIAAVLTPDKWLRFNVAAQAAGTRTDQRNLVSYVRGAWNRNTDEFEDRVVSNYLRPTSTWSGIVLRYLNATGGEISLVRLFFIKGSSLSRQDLNDLCAFAEEPLDLADLQQYAVSGLQTRKLAANFPAAVVTSNGKHGKFYARLRRVFGMPQETALQLLHKTQSAKSLTNLDQLFREYMLEGPRTFEFARIAVQQFGDLRDAHAHVVELRKQRDHLLKLRDVSSKFDHYQQEQELADERIYLLEPFLKRRELLMRLREEERLKHEVQTREAQLDRQTRKLDLAREEADSAARAVNDQGGSEARLVRERLSDAERRHAENTKRRKDLQATLREVGIDSYPTNAEEFTELQHEIASDLDANSNSLGPTIDQLDRLTQARKKYERLTDEVKTLRSSQSTVPARLQGVRSEIAAALQIPANALPFAAELIEVKPEFQGWTGAIERVLKNLALTLLVRSHYLPDVRRWVDQHHLGGRLVFEEVVDDFPPPNPARSKRSLVYRVQVEDSLLGRWLETTLSKRYDYVCVDSVDELSEITRAVTINGQLKVSQTRYEKDDRYKINDRSRWVLGNKAGKLEALIQRQAEAETGFKTVESEVDAAVRREAKRNQRTGRLRDLCNRSWSEFDVSESEADVTRFRTQLHAITTQNFPLTQALSWQDEAREALRTADLEHRDLDHKTRTARDELDGCRHARTALQRQIKAGEVAEVPVAVREHLEHRLLRNKRSVTLVDLHEVGRKVLRELQLEKDVAQNSSTKMATQITTLTTEFKQIWPSVAGDLRTGIEDRSAFLAVLDEILRNDLPQYEARFRSLLQDRSRDLVGELLNEILSAPGEIEDRVVPINEALGRSPFDADRYLRLRVKIQRSAVVQEFITKLREIVTGSWDEEDMSISEGKYALLAEIMHQFESGEHTDRSWRRQCLDTRLHVSFQAQEVDRHGVVHATYDSGAAMSGGQQQKLVVFCLAAALRYQLAQRDDSVPHYGTVILDEAFDKADSRYTRMALDIFIEFGFHLVLATPQKLLQTIEPYVGAATLIENPTRKLSVLSSISWEDHAAR